MPQTLKPEHLENLRSMMKAAHANGQRKAFLDGGITSSIYSKLLNGGGVGLINANKMLTVLGQPLLDATALAPFPNNRTRPPNSGSVGPKKRGRPPGRPRQASLFEEEDKTRLTEKENEALRGRVMGIAKTHGLSWNQMEKTIFPGRANSYFLNRYVNRREPALARLEHAVPIWEGLKRYGVQGPPPWEKRLGPTAAPVKPNRRGGMPKILTAVELLKRERPGLIRSETRKLRVAAIMKLRDHFKDDRPAMANALGMTTGELGRFFQGNVPRDTDLEAIRRLVGPPDQFPIRAMQTANSPAPSTMSLDQLMASRLTPPTMAPATMEQLLGGIDQLVMEIGRQTLLVYLNQWKPK